MVKRTRQRNERGMLTVDMFIAMGLLVIALIPISYSWLKEQQLCRAYYERALVTQILDGEMEALAAGEWRAFGEGEQAYSIATIAVTNVPPGKFWFHRDGKNLRLEFRSERNPNGNPIKREAVGQ